MLRHFLLSGEGGARDVASPALIIAKIAHALGPAALNKAI
jgi:hypothetical protein